ncbi:LysM peptidoglycan-binding domain-containing protein [uncultured Desulfobacter sp.]|uniref:LysM peptidoglycan-binding domain-containing protein n=1 Tax=uncultured Desulfobacter sp. TaxID=240139 RepID=UPI0029F4C4C7|nr:LysM peptidoglycan-binding domain-containing protein [uncultured Desulfobacter sp.]
MSALGVKYKVKEGDTLWGIAKNELGLPQEWPRIYAFNNMPEINATGVRKIDDPDLIYAGEIIRLPILKGMPSANSTGPLKSPPPGAVRAPQPFAGRPQSLKNLLPDTNIPLAAAYNIEWSHIEPGPGYVAKFIISGKLTVRLGKKVPVTYVVNQGLSASLASEAVGVHDKLFTHMEYSYDSFSKNIGFSNMMILEAKNVHAPKTAVGFAISPTSPLPVIRGEILYPTLEGSIGVDSYLATDVKITIDIEMKPPSPRPVPLPVPVHQPVAVAVRAPQPVQNNGVNWHRVGAYVAAGALTVGFAAWVYCSGGLGTVNTPQYAYAMSVILAVGVTAPALSQGGRFTGIR